MALARVTIYGTYGGSGHINVLHFQQTDATSTLFNNLGGYVDGFWVDQIRGGVDNNMKWQRIKVEEVAGLYPAYETSISRSGVLGPSNVFCPFIAAVFLLQTATAGRHGRGRSFQGGYGHGNDFNNGQWGSSTQTRIDDCAAALKYDWITAGSNVGNWKLVVSPRPNTDNTNFIPCTNIVGRSRIATMNTRKIGRGL